MEVKDDDMRMKEAALGYIRAEAAAGRTGTGKYLAYLASWMEPELTMEAVHAMVSSLRVPEGMSPESLLDDPETVNAMLASSGWNPVARMDRRMRLAAVEGARAHLVEALSSCAGSGVGFMGPGDPGWPEGLKGEGAPSWLFFRGEPGVLGKDSVALAGSRVADPQVASVCAAVGKAVAGDSVPVAGLAGGCALSAVSAAASAGRPCAVFVIGGLGNGDAYPAATAPAVNAVLKAGGLVMSETAPGHGGGWDDGHLDQSRRPSSSAALSRVSRYAAMSAGSLLVLASRMSDQAVMTDATEESLRSLALKGLGRARLPVGEVSQGPSPLSVALGARKPVAVMDPGALGASDPSMVAGNRLIASVTDAEVVAGPVSATRFAVLSQGGRDDFNMSVVRSELSEARRKSDFLGDTEGFGDNGVPDGARREAERASAARTSDVRLRAADNLAWLGGMVLVSSYDRGGIPSPSMIVGRTFVDSVLLPLQRNPEQVHGRRKGRGRYDGLSDKDLLVSGYDGTTMLYKSPMRLREEVEAGREISPEEKKASEARFSLAGVRTPSGLVRVAEASGVKEAMAAARAFSGRYPSDTDFPKERLSMEVRSMDRMLAIASKEAVPVNPGERVDGWPVRVGVVAPNVYEIRPDGFAMAELLDAASAAGWSIASTAGSRKDLAGIEAVTASRSKGWLDTHYFRPDAQKEEAAGRIAMTRDEVRGAVRSNARILYGGVRAAWLPLEPEMGRDEALQVRADVGLHAGGVISEVDGMGIAYNGHTSESLSPEEMHDMVLAADDEFDEAEADENGSEQLKVKAVRELRENAEAMAAGKVSSAGKAGILELTRDSRDAFDAEMKAYLAAGDISLPRPEPELVSVGVKPVETGYSMVVDPLPALGWKENPSVLSVAMVTSDGRTGTLPSKAVAILASHAFKERGLEDPRQISAMHTMLSRTDKEYVEAVYPVPEGASRAQAEAIAKARADLYSGRVGSFAVPSVDPDSAEGRILRTELSGIRRKGGRLLPVTVYDREDIRDGLSRIRQDVPLALGSRSAQRNAAWLEGVRKNAAAEQALIDASCDREVFVTRRPQYMRAPQAGKDDGLSAHVAGSGHAPKWFGGPDPEIVAVLLSAERPHGKTAPDGGERGR